MFTVGYDLLWFPGLLCWVGEMSNKFDILNVYKLWSQILTLDFVNKATCLFFHRPSPTVVQTHLVLGLYILL